MKRTSWLLLVCLLFGVPASAWFASEDPKRLNFKIVMLSEDRRLSPALTRELYEKLPAAAAKDDELGIVTFGSDNTLFFQFNPPGIEPVDGHQVRIYFYAIEPNDPVSEIEWDVAENRVLKGLDGLLLAIRCDTKNRCDEAKLEGRIRPHLEKAGYDWPNVPVVYEVHPQGKDAKPSLAAVRAKLGCGPNRIVVRAGDGATAIARAVLSAQQAGGLTVRISPEEKATAERLKVRILALSDLYVARGATTALTFPAQVVGELDISVFYFPATDKRPYASHATYAHRLGQYELVAHTLAATPKEEVGFALSSIDSADFSPYAVVESTDPRRPFLLVPPLEWPLESVEAGVRFLQAVPLTQREYAFGKKAGGRALAGKLNLAARGPAFGWRRTEKDSVVPGD